jgi:hypothetical protein
MSSIIYTCSVCGKQSTAEEGKPIPLCCNKEMEPLPFCTTQPHPEMARNYDEDLPCNDGTQAHPKPEPGPAKKG